MKPDRPQNDLIAAQDALRAVYRAVESGDLVKAMEFAEVAARHALRLRDAYRNRVVENAKAA